MSDKTKSREGPVHNSGRRMMSRRDGNAISIIRALSPGVHTNGCCVCCSAPACCPLFSVLPCCSDPEYILVKRQSSKYVYIRENSLEWNDPEVE